jgi:hypothetical protein
VTLQGQDHQPGQVRGQVPAQPPVLARGLAADRGPDAQPGLDGLPPPRRPRVSARKVESPLRPFIAHRRFVYPGISQATSASVIV